MNLFCIYQHKGIFDGDDESLLDLFCLLDMALLTCVEEDRLKEHQQLTLRFILDVWPTTCDHHGSSQAELIKIILVDCLLERSLP